MLMRQVLNKITVLFASTAASFKKALCRLFISVVIFAKILHTIIKSNL